MNTATEKKGVLAIIQITPEKLPVPMSQEQKSAYEKFVTMNQNAQRVEELRAQVKEQKEEIDAIRNQNEAWVQVQEAKRQIQQDLAENRKEELGVLSDLNKAMENKLHELDSLSSKLKERINYFDLSALEVAKDPMQVPLILFNDEGRAIQSVCHFTAKLAKQKKPRKKNRENAYTQSEFIVQYFEDRGGKESL